MSYEVVTIIPPSLSLSHSYRFMDMFPDTALIQDIQSELDNIIQMGVINITRLIKASEMRSNGMTTIPDPDIEQKKAHGKRGGKKTKAVYCATHFLTSQTSLVEVMILIITGFI